MDDRATQVFAQRTRPDAIGEDYDRTPDADAPNDPPASEFLARITGNAVADSPAQNRWKYAWQELSKTSAGYDGWANGSRSGTTSVNPGYHLIEDGNTGAGVEMNGVNVDGTDFPPGFSYQPVPDNALVVMRPVVVEGAGVIEYWFSDVANGIDGTCEEEE